MGERKFEVIQGKRDVVLQQEREITRLLVENRKLDAALREIEATTRGLTEFNPTYEKIHKIASEALGVSENDG